MKIEGYQRTWHAQDEATLRQVLELRDGSGGALFWLTHESACYPTLAIRICGEFADMHYIPSEGHPGFRALAEPSGQECQSSNFVYEGCDPATGEETPIEFVLPLLIATDLAIEFLRSEVRPSAASWFEL